MFIDEVQNVPEFEKLLEGLYVHPNIDLYVTGSNAFLLSSELATLLTSRAYEINVLPFSFAEYLEFTGKTTNPERAFADYVLTGGFPDEYSGESRPLFRSKVGHYFSDRRGGKNSKILGLDFFS